MPITLSKTIGEFEGSSDLIPSSQYALKVVKAELEGKASGQVLRLNYEVISDGPYKGRKPFPEYFGLGEDAQWKIAGLLKATGAPPNINKFDEKKLIGKPFICYVSQREYNGNMLNQYGSYSPYTEEAAKGIAAPGTPPAEVGVTTSDKEVDTSGW